MDKSNMKRIKVTYIGFQAGEGPNIRTLVEEVFQAYKWEFSPHELWVNIYRGEYLDTELVASLTNVIRVEVLDEENPQTP